MFSVKRGSVGMTELRRANFARAALSLVHNTSHSNAAPCVQLRVNVHNINEKH